jgi:hypothetical protein
MNIINDEILCESFNVFFLNLWYDIVEGIKDK